MDLEIAGISILRRETHIITTQGLFCGVSSYMRAIVARVYLFLRQQSKATRTFPPCIQIEIRFRYRVSAGVWGEVRGVTIGVQEW